MPYGVYINGMRCADLNDDGSEVHTNKIFVGGLGKDATPEVLKRYFEKFGKITDCTVKKERTAGFGFVHFDSESSAERVCNEGMHQLQGKWVEIRKAVPSKQTGTVVPSSKDQPRRAASPRSMREEFLRQRQSQPKKARSSSSSSTSSREKSRRKKKADKKKKKKKTSAGKKRSRSRSRSVLSCSSSSSSPRAKSGVDAAAAAAALRREAPSSNPEVAKAKDEVFKRLQGLQKEPKDERVKQWRALLREWHPDKNPERIEVATSVFQFLQKAKPMVESSA